MIYLGFGEFHFKMVTPEGPRLTSSLEHAESEATYVTTSSDKT